MAKSASLPATPPLEGEVLPGNSRRTVTRSNRNTGDGALRLTEKKWTHFIGLVADSVPTREAMGVAGLTRYAVEGVLRTDAKRKSQFDEAKLAALRSRWDADTVEEILAGVAMGQTVQAACDSAFRGDLVREFYRLLLKDPVVKELYDEARMIQAEKMALDDIIEISDNDENDETWDGKGNSAAVNRSRLKVDSRKWIASKLHYARFGDKIQQDVNANVVVDHAARLEEARKRKAAAAKK